MQFTRGFNFSTRSARKNWLSAYSYNGVMPTAVLDYQAGRYGMEQRVDFGAMHSFSRASQGWSFNHAGLFSMQAIDEPRFTTGFGDTARRGLLCENMKTNALPYSDMSGAAVGTLGSGGSLPTGWLIVGINQSDVTVESIDPVDGLPNVRLRLNGVPSTQVYIFFCHATDIPGDETETWTLGIRANIAAGSTSNLTSVNHYASGWTDVGGYVSGSTFTGPNFVGDLTTTSTNYTTTGNVTKAATAHIRPSLRLLTSGTIDVTLDIALPSATTEDAPIIGIPTNATAVTQESETVEITGITPGSYDVVTYSEELGQIERSEEAVTSNYWPDHLRNDVVQSIAFFPANSL